MATLPASTAPPAQARDWTVIDVLRWMTQRFTDRGLPSARLDAELLLAHALSLSRIGVYTAAERLLLPDERLRIRALIERRQAGESVAVITGHKEFWGLDLHVTRDVLVPRPETECLVEAALDLLPAPARPRRARRSDAEPGPGADTDLPDAERAAETAAPAVETPRPPLRLLDVGTGSGAIALALKHRHPDATVVACDASAAALAVAARNAERLALALDLRRGDLLQPVVNEAGFDLIAANLPYIPSRELAELAPEVQNEPRLALDGGPDGLLLIARLASCAPSHLVPGGHLVLEVGAGQAEPVADYLRRVGFSGVDSKCDLAGIARVVLGRWDAGA